MEKRELMRLSVQIEQKKIKLEDGSTQDSDAVLIVGGGTYNGIHFPTEELERAVSSFQGVPINLDHSDDKVGDVVGYISSPFMDGNKLRAKTVLSPETEKYKTALGFIKSRKDAGDVANVSVGVWLERAEEEFQGGTRIIAKNISADHLALVVHGACNPDDGCGIGLAETVTVNDEVWETDLELKISELQEQIKKEQLKKQIMDYRGI